MPTLQEVAATADSLAKLVGIVVPAIGPFRAAISTLVSLYTSRRPQREDGTNWSDEEISRFILDEVSNLAVNATAVRRKYEDLAERRKLRRD